MADVDDDFYDRADAHIHLSNDQADDVDSPGKVSASMMYGTARFNAWLSARGFESGDQMLAAKAELLTYFCGQYRQMLEDNLEDYAANFQSYFNVRGEDADP